MFKTKFLSRFYHKNLFFRLSKFYECFKVNELTLQQQIEISSLFKQNKISLNFITRDLNIEKLPYQNENGKEDQIFIIGQSKGLIYINFYTFQDWIKEIQAIFADNLDKQKIYFVQEKKNFVNKTKFPDFLSPFPEFYSNKIHSNIKKILSSKKTQIFFFEETEYFEISHTLKNLASNLRGQNNLVIDLSLDNKMQYFDNFNEWLSLEKTNSIWLNFLLSVFYENNELRNSENYIVFVLAQFIKEAQKEKKEIICIQNCSEIVDLEKHIIFKHFFKDFSRIYISKNVNDNKIIPYFKKIYPGKEFGMMSYTRVNFSKLESSEFLEHYFPNLTLEYEDEVFLTKETHNNPNLFFEFVLFCKEKEKRCKKENFKFIFNDFKTHHIEKIKKKHNQWLNDSNLKEREEKEKAMLIAVSSFSQDYNPLSKIDHNFLDFNFLNFDYLTKKYSPKNPIFMKFLIQEYYPTKRIEKFINSHHSVGLSQVSFVDLFKLYIYYFFQENIGKEIIFPELKIKYDEFLLNKFRINITFKLRNEVYIDPSIGIPLQQGKTILLSPKQLNSHFFDFLIINSNKCYFFGIKNKPGRANAFNRSLIFLLHSSYKFDENQVKEKLTKLKESINAFMVNSDDVREEEKFYYIVLTYSNHQKQRFLNYFYDSKVHQILRDKKINTLFVSYEDMKKLNPDLNLDMIETYYR